MKIEIIFKNKVLTSSPLPFKRMGKAAVVGIAFLGVILIVGGLFAYSYTQLSVSLNDVRFLSIDWVPITWSTLLNLGLNTLVGDWFGAAFELIDGINLNFIFGLTNNGLLPVYIPDLSYDILINGVSIGRGHSNINTTINPGQTEKIISFQNIRKNSLEPAAFSIISAEGVMNIKVKGTAYFQLFGLSIPIPFESSKQISIYDEIRNKINAEIQKNQPQQKSTSSSIGNAFDDILDSITGTLGSAINSIRDKIFDGSKTVNLSPSGVPLVDKTFDIEPGSTAVHYFILSCNTRLTGGVSVISVDGLGLPTIGVLMLDQNNFAKFNNDDQTPTPLYMSDGAVENDLFEMNLGMGEYYIFMSNTHSFASKTVQLAALTWGCQ